MSEQSNRDRRREPLTEDQVLSLYRDLHREVEAVRHKVKKLLPKVNWQAHGEWHEAVLRRVLRDRLPRFFEVNRGFVVKDGQSSGQIDILVTDIESPVLFREADFVICTPDVVRAAIEVKSNFEHESPAKAVANLEALIQMRLAARTPDPTRFFAGLFAFSGSGNDAKKLLHHLASARHSVEAVSCAVIGRSNFMQVEGTRPPEKGPRVEGKLGRYASYKCHRTAQGLFVNGLIQSLCGRSVADNAGEYFPSERGWMKLVADIAL